MKPLLLYAISFLLFAVVSYGQDTFPQIRKLQQISVEENIRYLRQKEKVEAYASLHGLEILSFDEFGNTILMVDVDEFGHPVYLKTFNADAGRATGAAALHQGGSLGLNLSGEGFKVGVWDGGLVLAHDEFGDRIVTNQGGSESNHATHVAGTIAAAGTNPLAKGMAPKVTITAWDFDNDISEIASLARPDESSLLLSNHSYGIVLGWNFNNNQWTWNGVSSVSAEEDYRFGFYTGLSRSIDEIAYDAPYYLTVWSAGNDRNDVGSGVTYPPDCNGGSGYDCIGPRALSKNGLAVGAIAKFAAYTGPESLLISNFSSWGPTDDGRIKPDLVGVGVAVLSASSSSPTSYTSLQGTSMSAPNVTGSLILLQELYNNLNPGSFMKSATLKALAIHTTKEAGNGPGPDYRFGWGLLDVEAAAGIILQEDNQNIFINELSLTEGSVIEIPLQTKANEKITATIVWTDPPGNPVSAALDPTDLMLRNDLDIRIVDDAGNIQFPWVLDPNNPGNIATKGDNFRDNVEKIEFENPEPRNYRLAVSHKGQLVSGQQDFSLVLTYTSLNDPRTTYYWIGDEGEWADPANWSLSSGGTSVSMLPTFEDRVVFDENSFSTPSSMVNLLGNVECYSLIWLAKQNAGISFNGNSITLRENLIIGSEAFEVFSGGSFIVTSEPSGSPQIGLSGNDLSDVTLVLNGSDASWRLNANGRIGEIHLLAGELNIQDIDVSIGRLRITGSSPKILNARNAIISDVEILDFSTQSATLFTNEAIFKLAENIDDESDPVVINVNGQDVEAKILGENTYLRLEGSGVYKDFTFKGKLEILGNNQFEQFKLNGGTEILLSPNTEQTFLSTDVVFETNQSSRISFSSPENSVLNFQQHFKSCFDFLDFSGVNKSGSGVVSIGLNSSLVNSDGWLQVLCDEVLFANFDVTYNCSGSIAKFTDNSSGDINSWLWHFGDDESTSTNRNPNFIFSETGDYEVSLIVSGSGQSNTYSAIITVLENELPENHVIFSSGRLISFVAADEYQWYLNGEVIEGETGRIYIFEGNPGNYFVTISDGECNKPSPVFVIASTEEESKLNPLTNTYPNPVSDRLFINTNDYHNGEVVLEIFNMQGAKIYSKEIQGSTAEIDVSNLPNSVYILKIITKDEIISRRIIVLKD